MTEVGLRLTPEQRRLTALLLRQRGLDPSQLPITRRPDASVAPLSPTQQRLWTSGQVAKGTSYGNVPIAVRIRGPLNLGWMSRALSLVAARHEVLRTTYPVEGRRPVQRIRNATPIGIAIEDMQSLGGRLEDEVAQEARRPFDPAVETPLRAKAFRLDVEDWGLVVGTHHLATDGWGARLLLDELSISYRAFALGQEPDLPALAVQYGDYAVWELGRLDSGELEPEKRYWLNRLAGAPSQLRLPFDGRPSRSLATEAIRISLSQELSEGVRKLSRAHGVTPYVTLLAAFKVLLQRSAGGQDDIVIGTIMSRRTRSETERLIGNFGNNLLLRTRLDGEPSGSEAIARVAATVRDAFAHSDVSLELIAQEASIPAFHVMFLLRDGSFEERLALPDMSVEPVPAKSGVATVDLALDLTDGSRGIEGYLEYRATRFERETVERLAEGFHDVVKRIVTEPQARMPVNATID